MLLSLNRNNLQTNSTVKIVNNIGTLSYDSSITDNTTNPTAAISTITSESSLEIAARSIITTRPLGLRNATLTKFCVSNNNITDEATDDIAADISCNIYLQELNLGSNNLQTSGAIKITRELQNINKIVLSREPYH